MTLQWDDALLQWNPDDFDSVVTYTWRVTVLRCYTIILISYSNTFLAFLLAEIFVFMTQAERSEHNFISEIVKRRRTN